MGSTDRVPKKKPRKPKDDFTQVAYKVFRQAIGSPPPEPERELSPKAAAGQKGGRSGGKARAARLSAEERREIARKAAQARWSK